MLVLSRKKNQSIVIDGGIEIQILQLKGGTVKVGISAPDDVRIVRGELEMYPEMEPAENNEPRAIPNLPIAVTEGTCDYFVNGNLTGKVMAK